MSRFLLPLSIFLILVVFLGVGLKLNPREVPSPFIDKPAPAFKLPQLQKADVTIAPEDLRGKVWLLNVWSSWCVSCRQEHPLLVELARRITVPIVGLNYKEVRGGGIETANMDAATELSMARERAKQWLVQYGGDPYAVSAMDLDGRVGIDYGVYGVPETFVIDKTGVIRYKHIGPLTPDAIEKKILPKLRELGGA